jgi:hypothetical protein
MRQNQRAVRYMRGGSEDRAGWLLLHGIWVC